MHLQHLMLVGAVLWERLLDVVEMKLLHAQLHESSTPLDEPTGVEPG